MIFFYAYDASDYKPNGFWKILSYSVNRINTNFECMIDNKALPDPYMSAYIRSIHYAPAYKVHDK